jgi:hypothetical protein
MGHIAARTVAAVLQVWENPPMPFGVEVNDCSSI